MIDENVWWMAVVEDEKLVGIITENDVAKAMPVQRRRTISVSRFTRAETTCRI